MLVSRGTAAQSARKPCVCRPVTMEAFVRSLILVLVVLAGSILTALHVHINYFILILILILIFIYSYSSFIFYHYI